MGKDSGGKVAPRLAAVGAAVLAADRDGARADAVGGGRIITLAEVSGQRGGIVLNVDGGFGAAGVIFEPEEAE